MPMSEEEVAEFLDPAKNQFMLHIYDAQKNHIVTLRLLRQEGMTRGDMHQMQVYLWQQLGEAIRDDKALQQRLAYGGIETLMEDPRVSPQASPEA